MTSTDQHGHASCLYSVPKVPLLCCLHAEAIEFQAAVQAAAAAAAAAAAQAAQQAAQRRGSHGPGASAPPAGLPGMPYFVKVSANSNPKQVAGKIAHTCREGDAPAMLTIGTNCINQAVKAICIARGKYLLPFEPADLQAGRLLQPSPHTVLAIAAMHCLALSAHAPCHNMPACLWVCINCMAVHLHSVSLPGEVQLSCSSLTYRT